MGLTWVFEVISWLVAKYDDNGEVSSYNTLGVGREL
jgi:hypothetical protein